MRSLKFYYKTIFGQSLPLKDPSQTPPFSMPSKLLILQGEVKSECFTIGCVSESIFNYLQELHSDFLCFIIPKLSHVNKNKGVAD